MSEQQQRKPMTILQQANFIEALAERCRMIDGSVAAETIAVLSADEAADLKALSERLYRMAPYESAIRRIVVGR